MNQRTRLFVFFSVFLIAVAAYAQSGAGSLSGTVTDPNGAVVSGAAVEAKESATGRLYPTRTTDAGAYVLPTLPVGLYSVSIEHPGFKKSIQSDIEVRVALRQTVDTRLEVGDVQQSVQVKGDVPLIETVSPERGQKPAIPLQSADL